MPEPSGNGSAGVYQSPGLADICIPLPADMFSWPTNYTTRKTHPLIL